MGRRRVHPPAPMSADHQTSGSGPGEQHKCYTGLGFHEEHYTVVIGPEPGPRFISSTFCRYLAAYCAAVTLILLLLLLHFAGARPPKTTLEALMVHDLNLTRETSLRVAPWVVNGNLTVVVQCRNRGVAVGFRHRYVTTLVSAWYGSVLLGRAAPVPGFTLGEGSALNVSARVLIREQCVNGSTAAAMRAGIRNGSVALRVAVDASVKVMRLWWPRSPKWFNSSSLVNVNTLDNVR